MIKGVLEMMPQLIVGLILDPSNAVKLADCGIAILDAPTDILPNVIDISVPATPRMPSSLKKRAKY